MSISDLLIKGLGILLAVVGVLLLLSMVGLVSSVSLQPWLLALVVGLLFIAIGVYLVRGGSITL